MPRGAPRRQSHRFFSVRCDLAQLATIQLSSIRLAATHLSFARCGEQPTVAGYLLDERGRRGAAETGRAAQTVQRAAEESQDRRGWRRWGAGRGGEAPALTAGGGGSVDRTKQTQTVDTAPLLLVGPTPEPAAAAAAAAGRTAGP